MEKVFADFESPEDEIEEGRNSCSIITAKKAK
jgi:hypothetical protein